MTALTALSVMERTATKRRQSWHAVLAAVVPIGLAGTGTNHGIKQGAPSYAGSVGC